MRRFAVSSCDWLAARHHVLSELRRPRPDAKVTRFISGQKLDLLFVSVVTFAEIRFGIERLDEASGEWSSTTG
jgi:predicted nucleic acid-binding protein